MCSTMCRFKKYNMFMYLVLVAIPDDIPVYFIHQLCVQEIDSLP